MSEIGKDNVYSHRSSALQVLLSSKYILSNDTPQRTDAVTPQGLWLMNHPETEAFLYTAMAKRKAISKRIRFEVFKRDKFKCQYCGRSAPDVVLQVDHIHPHSKGGKDAVLNYITSCFDCNNGKSDRELADDSVIKLQQQQLEQLAERREQLEMMMQWSTELQNQKKSAIQALIDHWDSLNKDWSVSDNGSKHIKKLTDQYSFAEIIEAMNTSANNYFEYEGNKVTNESYLKALHKISGICHLNRVSSEKPYIKDLYYIRAILRNRHNRQCNDVIPLMEKAIEMGVTVSQIKSLATNSWNYTGFCDNLNDLMA